MRGLAVDGSAPPTLARARVQSMFGHMTGSTTRPCCWSVYWRALALARAPTRFSLFFVDLSLFFCTISHTVLLLIVTAVSPPGEHTATGGLVSGRRPGQRRADLVIATPRR